MAGLRRAALRGLAAAMAMALPAFDANPAHAQDELSCADFLAYDDAQAYYTFHPEAQPALDPDQDGAACETWFGLEAPAYLPGGPPAVIPSAVDPMDEDC